MTRKFSAGLAAGILFVLLALSPARAGQMPAILSLKEQSAVYDAWLTARLDTVLPEVMRREKIDLWLVICQEYNEDPVYLSLVPWKSLSSRRSSRGGCPKRRPWSGSGVRRRTCGW